MNDFMQQTNRECSQRLKDFLNESKSLAYFIGSGVSIGNYPDWAGIPSKMKEIYTANGWTWLEDDQWLQITKENPQKLQELFEEIKNLNTEHYINSLKEIFDAEPINHKDYLLQIIKSNPRLLVTLNFDISIQAAYTLLDKHHALDARVFPYSTHLSPERENSSVLMHLHGKYHDKLLGNPDHIVLHKSGYDYAYNHDPKPLRSLLKTLFLDHDVVFIGTGMTEPEMVEFLRALTDRVQEGGIKRRRIALLPTSVIPDNQSAPREISSEQEYQMEKSADRSRFAQLGIECLRFFPLGPNFRGLHEIITEALGSNSRPELAEISW